MRVLLVDDDELITSMLLRYLSTKGHEVIATTSPEAAMYLIRHARFDALITDLGMEPVNGIDLIRKLRSLDADCKVILMSGTAEWQEIEQQLYGTKVDSFIEKPFQLEDFHEKVTGLTR